LRESLQIPHTLEELIHEDTKLEEMSAMALVDPSTGGNPIDLNQLDFLKLYQDSFKGILM
jgi:alcohol dehydrogenase class IV